MSYNRASELLIERITSSRSPSVVFGIGIPGSGKSTLLKAVARELTTSVVDVDEITRSMRRSDWGEGAFDRLGFRIDSEVSKHIVQGGVALIDSTNCEHHLRAEAIERYRSIGAQIVGAAWLDTPLETAISRDSKRLTPSRVGTQTILAMNSSLQRCLPSEEEGFDWLEKFDDL